MIRKRLMNTSFQCCAVKPVYWFGIPNSDPQTLNKPHFAYISLDFSCKLSSPFIVTEPRERCFELPPPHQKKLLDMALLCVEKQVL